MKRMLLILLAVFAFSGISFAAEQAKVEQINLNTATQEQLETLNGVGAKKALAIIDYRAKVGSFKTVDDLDNVKGFSKKSIDKFRSMVITN